MPTDLPVTAVEGIGPATAAKLDSIGVVFVSDLLFVSDHEVHRAAIDSASLEQAIAWREMAAMMEVEGVDGQVAEAIVKGGIETVEELSGKGFGDLRDLFAAALDAGSLPEAPDDEALAGMIRSATRIDYGGVAMGRIVEATGAPVEGATIRVGEGHTSSDGQGRFRIVGIKPAASHHLRVEVEGQAPHVQLDHSVVYDPRIIGGPTIVLDGRASAVMDEFDGDVLPSLEGTTTQWWRFPDNALREGDVLQLHDFYVSAEDVKVVSIFRAFEAGELVIRHARVPLSIFEAASPQKGEVFRLRDGVLKMVAGGIAGLEMHRANRRALRELREMGDEAATMDSATAVAWLSDALKRHHVLSQAFDTAGEDTNDLPNEERGADHV